MNNENLAFLHDNLKYLGFGEKLPLNEQLEQEIAKETKEFQLHTEAFYDDDYKVEAILHFRKADQYDMYFFNKYEALLRRGDNPDMDRKQTFYISKGSGVTFKEAFNLLQGRAVNKDLTNIEGEKYNAWIQLNFGEMDLNHNYKMRQYRLQYGYDLEKVLENYPIRELKTEESRTLLIKALKRGNLQPVNLLKGNKAERIFIEANPQFKSINIYSSTARAAEKLVKKPDRAVREGVSEKPGDTESGEWKEEDAAAMEEGNEEGVSEESVNEGSAGTRAGKPSAKKGSRK